MSQGLNAKTNFSYDAIQLIKILKTFEKEGDEETGLDVDDEAYFYDVNDPQLD